MWLWTLLACSGPDDSGTLPSTSWIAVGEGLDSALLSIWGTAWDDVWVVGADSGDGGVFLHFDGNTWEKAADLGAGDAWWVTGSEKVIWVGGDGGRIFRYNQETQELVMDTVDPSTVIYGVWAASDNEAWAVGGNTTLPGDAAAMYHYQDGAWSKVELPAEAAAKVALFKVSGSKATDLWTIGSGGMAMHYDGSAWTVIPTGVSSNLFGFAGRYAVGGDFTGSIVAWDGKAFVEETPMYSYQFEGVSDDGEHTPLAVGYQGTVFARGEHGWEKDPDATATLEDLHAVWVDPEGGAWSVGGHLSSAPLIHGVLIYKGAHTIAPLESR